MARRLYIPDQVKQCISAHLEREIPRAVSGYLSASEDEDTLTGHLGARLRIDTQNVEIQGSDFPGVWRWSIDYHKFRGRGPGATERILGADGIFELRLDRRAAIDRKSLLFQAKNDWRRDPSLLGQCLRLSTWREAAFVLNYTPNEFQAYSIDQVIRSKGVKQSCPAGKPLQEYLGTDFLDCLIGSTALYYDAHRRKLVWQTMEHRTVATTFKTGHRFRLNIRVPPRWPLDPWPHILEIPSEEVHNHRMEATDDEILAIDPGASEGDAAAAKRNLALTYHPDMLGAYLDRFARQALNRRMQEVNQAYERFCTKKVRSSDP